MGTARLDILAPAAVAAYLRRGGTGGGGARSHLAALGIRVDDLTRTRMALGDRGRVEGGRIRVAAADAFGLALEFAEEA